MNCRICNVDNGHSVIAKDNLSCDEFQYWQCHSCGVVYLINVPDSFLKYYSGDYYSLSEVPSTGFIVSLKNLRDNYLISGKGFLGSVISKLLPNGNLRALKLLNINESNSLLDIGCGIGKEIRLLRKSGIHNVLGADPFIEADIYLNKERLVEKKNIYQLNGTFDFITLHHSFEHMNEPLNVLCKLKQLLSDNGKIMIRIPVADSYAYKKFGTSWVQFDPPRHIYLHTQKSLEILAAQAKLRITSFIHDSNSFQFWGSRINKKGISIHSASKKMVLFNQLISFFKNEQGASRKLNKAGEGDQAIFLLEQCT